MTRAVALSAYGGPEVLGVIDVESPVPGAGQVVVDVRAAGVNPVDCKIRAGWFAADGDVFPQRLGNEFAGVVTAVAPDVDGVLVGQEVLGFTAPQAYAERIAVPAGAVVAKPAALGWAAAGSLSAAGQTAATGVRDLGVGPGETLLVHGAAGGDGGLAVQLGRLAGATVIGTASRGNHDHLADLGAVPVEYGPGLLDRVRALAPAGVDAVLDLVGGDAVLVSLDLVADRARIGTTVDDAAVAEHGIRRVRGARSAALLARLAGLAAAGQVRHVVSKTFPLTEATAAHREVETGHTRGKAVLLVD
ncbi:NADP-dependent oxidoreductase [Actinokineospora pegani]|uniref:NADP-dependent oxidoreductase n=1 Tax=Actinokineospora pegani TaxID=2654637 RepID=UPI0012EB026E|nr:NADP-dependent oxidoreductase [Actinokineospora pegani]